MHRIFLRREVYLSVWELCISLLAPLQLPSPQRQGHAACEWTDDDQRDDPGVRDQPEYDSDIVAMPCPSRAMTEESIGFRVEVFGQDVESVQTYDGVISDEVRFLAQSSPWPYQQRVYPIPTCVLPHRDRRETTPSRHRS